MPSDSAIEWTDASWNVWTGCTQISPGCAHCYAKELAEHRFPNHFPNGFALTYHWERLDWPLHRQKPLKIFVNSMSDLFLESVPDEAIDRVFATMALTPRHVYQVLTKRPERMAAYVAAVRDDSNAERVHQLAWERQPGYDGWDTRPWPLPNVWLGVSIENNRFVERATLLRATPAAVRFLSCEPLLGPLPDLRLDGIDWVIVGGESGKGHRPMNLDWARALRDRAQDAGAAFFYKQAAGPRPGTNRLLDGRTWDEFPTVGSLLPLGVPAS